MYSATIGGLGLTGLITWAEIQLRSIRNPLIAYTGTKFHGLEQFHALSTASKAEYTVAWLDTVSTGSNFARGIFMEGDHSAAHEPSDSPLIAGKPARLPFPIDLPEVALNRFTVGLFNNLFFHKQLRHRTSSFVHFDPFFFPLDAIHNWNRLYGKSGLLQFQCVVPPEAMPAMLRVVSDAGLASFLAVLKVFGNVASPGMLSFPRPRNHRRTRLPHSRRKNFRAIRSPRRHDPRRRRPPLSRQGRPHDRRAIPALLSAVSRFRAIH